MTTIRSVQHLLICNGYDIKNGVCVIYFLNSSIFLWYLKCNIVHISNNHLTTIWDVTLESRLCKGIIPKLFNIDLAYNEALRYHSNVQLTNLKPRISPNLVQSTTKKISQPIQGSSCVLYSNVWSLISKLTIFNPFCYIMPQCYCFERIKVSSWNS